MNRITSGTLSLVFTVACLIVAVAHLGTGVASAGPRQDTSGGGSPKPARVKDSVSSCLKLRAEASLESTVAACMAPGTPLTILEQGGEWSRVRLEDDREGWMAARFLEMAPSADAPARDEVTTETLVSLPPTGSRETASGEALPGGTAGSADPELERLTRQARDLEANIALLTRSVDEYSAAEQDLIQRRQASQESLRLLRERDQEAKVEEERLLRRVASAEESVRELRQLTQAGREGERTLRAELDLATAAVEETRDALAGIREVESSLDEELEASLGRISDLEAAIEESQARRELMREELSRSLTALAALEERLAATLAVESELERQAAELTAGVAALSEVLDERRAREGRLRGRLEASAIAARELEASLGAASSEGEAAERVLVELDSRLAELEGRAAELGDGLPELAGLVDSAGRRASELRARVESALEEYRALEGRVSSARAVAADLERQVLELESLQDELSRGVDETEPVQPPVSLRMTPPEPERAPAPEVVPRTPASPAIAGPPPVAEAVLEPPPSPVPAAAEVETMVRAWAAAWERRDVETYLAFYAASFEPARGATREAWAAERRAKIGRASDIRIELADLELVSQEGDRAAVRFRQSFASRTFSDKVIKRLDVVREEDGWRIVRETVLNTL